MTSASEAVDALNKKYGKLVFHTIYGLTGDWEESQDLTQDTFHQALKSIDAARIASGTQFREKAWLMSIAVNTVRMNHRRHILFRFIPFSRMQKGKYEEKSDEREMDTLNERAAPVQPAGYGAVESHDPAETIAERDTVQRTMRELPEPLRECLLLSIIGNFSTHEIAEMLDLQEAAVRQRLSRARKQFQQIYTRESGESIENTDATGDVTRVTSHKHQKFEGRVESCIAADTTDETPSSSMRRGYAERLYRKPAFTPLW